MAKANTDLIDEDIEIADVGVIIRKLCENKGVEIHVAEACPDHIHMLVSIPPHISVAQFMGF